MAGKGMQVLREWVKLYSQQFKTTFATMLQYRASLFIWMISSILEPLIYLIVWSTVSRGSGGSVGNYTAGRLRRLLYRPDAGQPVHLHLDHVRI